MADRPEGDSPRRGATAPGTVACKQSTEPSAQKRGGSQKPQWGYRLQNLEAAMPHECETQEPVETVMKSPLDIDETVKRYNLDKSLKEKLIVYDSYIWQDCSIETVEQIVAFEKDYQQLGKDLDFLYDNEAGEFSPVWMEDGPLCLLSKGRFQQFSNNLGSGEFDKAFMEAGLSELETLMIKVFRADLSELFRKDAYYRGLPPIVLSLCEILNKALSKLPSYSDWVVRACNEYDKADFKLNDVFTPGFCLTTSADLSWKNTSENRYRIKPLTIGSKSRAMFLINNNTEYQVTFLQDARFQIVEINEWGEGKNEFVMLEL